MNSNLNDSFPEINKEKWAAATSYKKWTSNKNAEQNEKLNTNWRPMAERKANYK